MYKRQPSAETTIPTPFSPTGHPFMILVAVVPTLFGHAEYKKTVWGGAPCTVVGGGLRRRSVVWAVVTCVRARAPPRTTADPIVSEVHSGRP